MSSEALRTSAREGSRAAGRSVVMSFDDEVRYTTIEDLRGALAEAPELAGLIEVAHEAVEIYDPDREAVFLESGPDAVSIYAVRQSEIVMLGSLAFTTQAGRTASSRSRDKQIRRKRVRFCII